MELFPDLSLKISPPNKSEQENIDSCFRNRAILLDSKNTIDQDLSFDLSLSPPKNPRHHGLNPELSYLMPIKGMPNYQNTLGPFWFSAQPCCYTDNGSVTCSGSGNLHNYPCGDSRSRFMARFNPPKRGARAPRMRWTATLHSQFVHAVERSGGRERATPKSVLELMDVKDLTLAHVKSHLQMYRTKKTIDRTTTSSEQSEVFENGWSGDTSEDVMFNNQNRRNSQVFNPQGKKNKHQDKDYYGDWSNSSREDCLNRKRRNRGENAPYVEDLDPKCLISDVTSSNVSYTRSCPKKPNLEFTLGTPQS